MLLSIAGQPPSPPSGYNAGMNRLLAVFAFTIALGSLAALALWAYSMAWNAVGIGFSGLMRSIIKHPLGRLAPISVIVLVGILAFWAGVFLIQLKDSESQG
jgi:hypothetical protein